MLVDVSLWGKLKRTNEILILLNESRVETKFNQKLRWYDYLCSLCKNRSIFEKRTFSRFNYQTYIITNEVDTSKLYSLLEKWISLITIYDCIKETQIKTCKLSKISNHFLT